MRERNRRLGEKAMQNVQNELLTRRQVAELFQVSPLTVIKWESAGKLPALRLGAGSVRYRREDVQAFITASVSK